MGNVTRFQVMAVLQSARARALGLERDEAKSWGLRRPIMLEVEAAKQHHDPIYVLGGEKAYRIRDLSEGLRFRFGSQVQTPQGFDQKIKSRFDDWKSAWIEAVGIIKLADRRDLDIQSRFFNRVYKPGRDELAEKWSRLEKPELPPMAKKRAA